MRSRMQMLGVGSVLCLLSLAAPATAALKCSAKTSAKDGTISVAGSGATGVVRWGVASGAQVNAFANEATCVVAGKLKDCQLGAPGSAAAITPPELCRVWVRDDASECAAYLKGCTPGARPVGGPALDPRFGSNTSLASEGVSECVLGAVWLAAGLRGGAVPADGRILAIGANTALFSLIGNVYGGDPSQGTFALPDLRSVAPNGLTYVICARGIFPGPPP